MDTRLPFACAATLCLATALHAQPPVHQGVVYNQTGSTASVVNGVTADADGNLIITGWRSDPLDLGGTAHPDGTGAIFLARFNGQGAELWSKVSGSADQQGNHKGMGVAVDGNGNVYNCGWVFAVEQATFDGTTLPTGTAGYVAKYTAGGTLLWVKDFAGGVNAIAVDGNGTPFINLGDASIVKLDPATGKVVWQQKVGRGGIQGGVHFGMAADDRSLYVPITDMPDGREYTESARPGLHAIDLATGEAAWYAQAPTTVCGDRDFCHPGISQAVTVAGDVVFGAL